GTGPANRRSGSVRKRAADGADLLLRLDASAPQPLYAQVYDGLREAILSGRLRGGERLPSTRVRAAELGTSRHAGALAAGRLRGAIVSGRLRGGARLPSTRVLAADLGVSRNTVVLAYERLLVEGYVAGRRGGGTRVRPVLPDPPLGANAFGTGSLDVKPPGAAQAGAARRDRSACLADALLSGRGAALAASGRSEEHT